ncbi:MAG: polysaccharide biosynthesis protein [Dictyoglomus thermophilum]|uniref:Polysaccharide biosynthesis protein n=1 Tax=Dictyoglomus thermophilum TaxID=14 RepID=A0A7V4DXN7_DICTH|nr:nucleoside-diphosphate sugar epimerase/dehydratase [Dictyoglomus thermophilum]MCX7720168.1 polysaccharide biosynthesis protein [Dictyoglomus thermophilum]
MKLNVDKFSRVPFSTLIRVIIDYSLFVFAIFFSFLIRFEFALPPNYWNILLQAIFRELAIFFFLYTFLFKLHRTLWEYFSLEALKELTLAVTLEKVIFFLSHLLLPISGLPRSIVVISYFTSLLFLFSVRAFSRWYHESSKIKSKKIYISPKRVVIVGAGDAGEKILREIKTNREINYDVVGFLDDDPKKIGKTIHGVKILGPISSLPTVVVEKRVQEILVAIPSASPSLLRNIVSMASKLRVPVKTLPGIWELIDGKVTISKIRNVKIEDLLERDVINLDSERIGEYLRGKKVLVTGAGGSIGSEICRQVASYKPRKLILLGRGENSIFNIELELKSIYPKLDIKSYIADIRDRDRVFYIFSVEKPDIVFHAAAHKHVPLMEENPDEAVFNNVFGTINLMDASKEYGVSKFIFISTDKAVYPSNIMGATKRVGEILIKYYNSHSKTEYIAVRFGNVLGSRGSVLEVFRKQLEKGGPITVTHEDMERYFMTIPEAVGLVLQAGAIGRSGDLFVLDMGKPIKIIDLARNFIELSGYSLDDIEIKITGLRPGEKLKEDLWEKEEVVERTEHPKILRILADNNIDYYSIGEKIKELELIARTRDKEKIWKALKEIVELSRKSYKSKEEVV